MRKVALLVLALALTAAFVLAVAGWGLAEPERARPSAMATGPADVKNGHLIFFAGGCASCHATPGQPNTLLLGGGVRLGSPFGTFVTPNISPDPEYGIGGWTDEQFATALLKGTSPDGQHFYPSLPYTAYERMKPEDVRDLFAFIKTLPASSNVPPDHDFPLNLDLVRRGVGLWKRLHLGDQPFVETPGQSAEWNRGAYLVEALGHCAECHSPRSITGGIVSERRMAGGVDPENKRRIPNITQSGDGIGDWSEDDIFYMLTDGSTPDDVVSGKMKEVVENTSQLPELDRRAMAIYLKNLPPPAEK